MSHTIDLKARLAQMGLVPQKSLGQNFLISPHVIAKIVEAVRARAFTDLVEVGPGLGALTEPLLAHGFTPRLLELDRDLATYWRGRGLEVMEGDALQINWCELNLRAPALFVSNLPYQISTGLVIERCFAPRQIEFMVLMFQKEVAQRLTALPSTKEYGFLSILVQLHFRMSRVTDAGPGDFFPAPKVASRVLQFERLQQEWPPSILRFAKQAFAFRRKYLLKNLKSVVDKAGQERARAALEAMGFSAKARAEELNPSQFAELFKKVYEH